jgi:hypothetical protein
MRKHFFRRGVHLRPQNHSGLIEVTAGLMALATMMGVMAGCSTAGPKIVQRPAGQVLVVVISTGTVDDVAWQAEVVRQDGKTCTQAVVAYRIMATACDFTVASDRPVNFEVEGNDSLLFVDGAVSSVVDELDAISMGRSSPTKLNIAAVSDGSDLRYFGYATSPRIAQDLIAKDASGRQIYSGGAKIRSSWVPPSNSPTDTKVPVSPVR